MAATLSVHLRESWRELKRGQPGRRFQARYERARRDAHAHGAGQRIALYGLGLAAFVIGALLVVFPGPALPFFFLAGGLLASESRTLARFMDWSEVRLRKLLRWGRARWRRLPVAARIALLVLGAGGSAATMAFTYQLFRR